MQSRVKHNVHARRLAPVPRRRGLGRLVGRPTQLHVALDSDKAHRRVPVSHSVPYSFTFTTTQALISDAFITQSTHVNQFFIIFVFKPPSLPPFPPLLLPCTRTAICIDCVCLPARLPAVRAHCTASRPGISFCAFFIALTRVIKTSFPEVPRSCWCNCWPACQCTRLPKRTTYTNLVNAVFFFYFTLPLPLSSVFF